MSGWGIGRFQSVNQLAVSVRIVVIVVVVRSGRSSSGSSVGSD